MAEHEIAARMADLERRIERLETQDPIAGALRHAAGGVVWPDADGSVHVQLGDAAGAQALDVQDVGGVVQARIDSHGRLTILRNGAGVYFGDPTVDGSWFLYRDGTSMRLATRQSGTWVVRQSWAPSG